MIKTVDSATRFYVAADNDNRQRVAVLSGGTVYYGGPTVTSGSNDGSITLGNDVTLTAGKWLISASTSGVGVSDSPDVHIRGDLTVDGNAGPLESTSDDYSAPSSYQEHAADLNLAAGAGTSDAGDSTFLGGIMGNVLGSALTKTHNFVAGLIGAYSVETSNASDLPSGAVLGILSDGSQGADGAVVAVLDNGDPGADTNATAAFKAMANTNRSGTSVEYGVDLYDAGRDSTLYSGGGTAFKVTKADVRLTNQVCILNGAGAPSNGTTGDNYAAVGSLYIDKTAGKLYINTGAIDNPTWTIVGTQS